MVQLEVDVESTFQSIKFKLGLSITPKPRVPSLIDYIKDWKLSFWETFFLRSLEQRMALGLLNCLINKLMVRRL
jgi:hypothetical protein